LASDADATAHMMRRKKCQRKRKNLQFALAMIDNTNRAERDCRQL